MSEKITLDVVRMGRLRKKIKQRDEKIAGLTKRITELEHMLARAHHFPRDLERVVQRALSNVRLIPVLGIGTDPKILDVRYSNEVTK